MNATGTPGPEAWFREMIQHCQAYATSACARGAPLVGILCEFTPRELILAAGAIPVCLCGGSARTIPPAERHLPVNLCPLIKSTFGYHVSGTNPFLRAADLVVAETTCDGKKKMFELMWASKPMYVLELPQKADDQDSLERWTRELRKLKAYLEERYRVEITDQKLRDAIAVMNRERGARRALAELMAEPNPPLTGRRLMDFRSIISGIEADLRQYEAALGTYAGRCDALGTSRARVLLTGVPVVRGAERVVDLIEGAGALVVAMENCTGLKPILEDVQVDAPDPIAALARKYYHLPCSVLTPNPRRLDTLRGLARKYSVECVVDLVWQACLTYDVESAHVRRLCEQELGLPYLKIGTDYSPGDSARITSRVEALLETVRSRRNAASQPLAQGAAS